MVKGINLLLDGVQAFYLLTIFYLHYIFFHFQYIKLFLNCKTIYITIDTYFINSFCSPIKSFSTNKFLWYCQYYQLLVQLIILEIQFNVMYNVIYIGYTNTTVIGEWVENKSDLTRLFSYTCLHQLREYLYQLLVKYNLVYSGVPQNYFSFCVFQLLKLNRNLKVLQELQ